MRGGQIEVEVTDLRPERPYVEAVQEYADVASAGRGPIGAPESPSSAASSVWLTWRATNWTAGSSRCLSAPVKLTGPLG